MYFPLECSDNCRKAHYFYGIILLNTDFPIFNIICSFFNDAASNSYWLNFPPAFTLLSCSTYFSTLKMEATCSSRTSIDFQRTTRRYIPEDRTLHTAQRRIIPWQWIMNLINVEWSGPGQFLGHYTCRDWRESRQDSVRIVGVIVEIQTGNCQNRNQKRYRLYQIVPIIS
jgi:hypothetical protein